MLKRRDREACFCPATPAPDARSITALAVATVKLCKVAAPKESQPAACGRCACEAEAGFGSFGSSILKSLTVLTTSISRWTWQVVAGVEDEDKNWTLVFLAPSPNSMTNTISSEQKRRSLQI